MNVQNFLKNSDNNLASKNLKKKTFLFSDSVSSFPQKVAKKTGTQFNLF